MNNRVKQIRFQGFEYPTEEFLLVNNIDHNAWESILAYLATLTNFSYTESGLIDPRPYVMDNFKPDEWHRGLYKFIMNPVRGEVVYGKLCSVENLPYCSLVPIILAAHKKYNDIPYNKWALPGLNGVVNKQLYDVMALKGSVSEFTKEYLLEIRNISLMFKSGAKAGTYRNPRTCYVGITGVSKMDHQEIKSLPVLAQIILIQTWAAHPANRHKYMILDLNDWDKMPEPLEDSTLFQEDYPEKSKKSTTYEDVQLPWDY